MFYSWRAKLEQGYGSKPVLLQPSSGGMLFVQHHLQSHHQTDRLGDDPPKTQNVLQFLPKLLGSNPNGSVNLLPIGNALADSSLQAIRSVELSSVARQFLDGSRRVRVVVGGGLTSSLGNGSHVVVSYMRMLMPFFRYLLPTFCRTASPGYDYHFYFAYDYDDPLFQPSSAANGGVDGMAEFLRTYNDIATINCRDVGKPVLRMIRCEHKKNPAWAQNDAMMQAYLDGMDFFYR